MLRRSMRPSAVLGPTAAAVWRRAVACAQTPTSHGISAFGAPILPPWPSSCVRRCHLSCRTTLLLRPPAFFRGYARMRRRSPPVQRPLEESESESESDSEVDDSDLPAEQMGEVDGGDEPVEWEGYEIRFGSDEGGTDEEEDVT